MSDGRAWYREPETFVAIAALVVSITAVVVGVYEAWLQRSHDRAEVWPHLEIQTWVSDSGAKVDLDNTGLGPALVKSILVTVDGKAQRDWKSVLTTLYGHAPPPHGSATVYQHAIRPGDGTTMVQLPVNAVPQNFYDWVGRVVITVCYSSVFGESFIVSDTPGKSSRWRDTPRCPSQPANADL